MATAVPGISKITAATMRWNRLTSRTLCGRVERVLGELRVAVIMVLQFGIRMPSRIRSIQRPPRRLRLCPESLAMEPGNVPTPVGPGPQTLRLIRFIIET